MPNMCFIKSCKQRGSKQNNITFHLLPRANQRLRSIWIHNIGQNNIKISTGTKICSKHFEESCFDRTGQTTRLRENACPTLLLNRQPNTSIIKINNHNNNEDPPKTVKTKTNIDYIQHDHNYDGVPKSSEFYKQKFKKVKHELMQAKKTIQILKKQLQRRNNRITNLQKIVSDLKNNENSKNFITNIFLKDSQEFPFPKVEHLSD